MNAWEFWKDKKENPKGGNFEMQSWPTAQARIRLHVILFEVSFPLHMCYFIICFK